MSHHAFLELRTGSALSSVRLLNELLDVALRELAVGEGVRHDVALGVAELVANVHEHEYRGREDGDVLVRIDLDATALAVTIESKGAPFDPTAGLAEAPEPSLDDLDALEVGGLGIPLLFGLFDEVRHVYEEGRGNRVTLRKALVAG